MNRDNNFAVQFFVGVMLLLVLGGCAPGSTGSGDGPSSASPPTVTAPSAGLSLPVDTNNLPIGSMELPIGQSFTVADLNGVWYDSRAGLVLEVSTSSTTLLTTVVVRQSCYSFTSNGPWPAQTAPAVQASGSLTSNSAGIASGPYRLIVTQPLAQQVFIELLSQGNSSLVLSSNLVRYIPTTSNQTPQLGPC